MFKRILLVSFCSIGLWSFAVGVLAAVTITPATGGTNISADKAANASSPAYTTLGNIVITENNNNDISTNGTFTIQPPAGWNFNTTGVTTSTTGGLGVTATTQTATLLTLVISGRSNAQIQSFTIIGLQVRATNGASLPSSGNITRAGGTASVSGITSGVTSLGSLSQVVGAKNKLAFTTQPSTTATRNVDFTTKPVVTVQDQFGNTVTTDNSSTVTLASVLSTQSCGGTAGSGTLSSTPSSGAVVAGGLMIYTAMQYSAAESIKICATSAGLSPALSNTIAVSNPVPTTTSISPTSKTVGDLQFTLTVNGTDFVADSVVKFDGSNRTTTYVNPTQVTAVIPASDLLSAGIFNITVFNPAPGGGTSNTQIFTVSAAPTNPTPTTTSISPSSKTVGDAQFNMTVNGANFIASSVVKFDGSDRVTTYVDSTQLTAVIQANDLTTAGAFSISVFNPAPGGGTSNAQTFTVTSAPDAQAPVVTAFSLPSSADSLTISITTFSATDNVGVFGYLLTESPAAPSAGDTGWVSFAPTSYTFATQGAKTLYAWAKDAAGNVSVSLSDTTTITLTETPPSAPSVAAQVNAVSPTIVRFTGQAFPGAKIFVVDKDTRSETAVFQEILAQEDGMFDVSFTGILQGQHGFGLSIKDKDNRTTQTKFFNVDTASSGLTIKNIIVPPTAGLLNYSVRRGNNLTITGYAPVGHLVKFEIDGKITGETNAGTDGFYKLDIGTGPMEFGAHSIRAKQVDDTKQESDFSPNLNFNVSRLSTDAIKVDFNNDGKVNIQDWSIFLFRWSSTDSTIKKSIDLNGDGAVNIVDFSIFIRNVRK